MCVSTIARIPLIADLITGDLPAGSILLVEYDPSSQWYAASVSMAAGWLRTGGRVMYVTYAQPPDGVRSQLSRLGVIADELEKNDKLEIWDGYTCQLGQRSKEKYAHESLKVSDLSIMYAREQLRRPPAPELLRISDNASSAARVNDEKALVEYLITRAFPSQKLRKVTSIRGIIRGLHGDWLLKHIEAASDGIIDFRLDETSEETRNLIRIRTMRNVGFDSRWHQVRVSDNFEVTLEK